MTDTRRLIREKITFAVLLTVVCESSYRWRQGLVFEKSQSITAQVVPVKVSLKVEYDEMSYKDI